MIDAARRAITARWRSVGIGALAVAAAAYAVAGDPHRRHPLVPRCPVKLITGLDCPACGGLRLAHDLAHRDVRAALYDNAFLLVCGPVLATLAWRTATAPPESGTRRVPAQPAYALVAAALLWMGVRNLPFWPLKPIQRD